MMTFEGEDAYTNGVAQTADLTPAQVVEAEIRAAEIVAQVGYGGPLEAYEMPTSWITDEEKEFLDDIAATSSLGDGLGDGSIEADVAQRAIRHAAPHDDLMVESARARRVVRQGKILGALDEDQFAEDQVLDLSEEEMEGWRRWSCCGEPDTVGQHAGWLAHQMIAHASVRAGWREELAPNPWWYPLPWQSDDTTPIDKQGFAQKHAYGAYFLAELCEKHFYKPIVDAAAKVHFYWEHRGAYETTAVWVIEMDYSDAAPADHKKFLVAAGSAVRVDRSYQAPFLRSRFSLISRHVLLHDAKEAARKATEVEPDHASWPPRAFWPNPGML